MKNGLHKHEHWITAGLIAVAVIFLSYAQLRAGTATYTYDAVNRLTQLDSGSIS